MERSEAEAMRRGAAAAPAEGLGGPELGKQRLVGLGTLLGALAASSCCILPLVLFSIGVSGAWIGNLTALAPYQPIIVTATLLLLGYGFYGVYWKPRLACAEGAACGHPLPNRLVKTSLWLATVLVAAAMAFPYLAPTLLGT